MGVLLGLLAAVAYGTSDFGAGVASRRLDAGPVTTVAQAFGLLAAGIGVLLFPGPARPRWSSAGERSAGSAARWALSACTTACRSGG